MSRRLGQTVADSRLPRGLRIVDGDAPKVATANDAAAITTAPAAPGVRVPPPAGMPQRLRKRWDQVTAPLAAAGLMSHADSLLIEVLLREVELYITAADAVRGDGPVTETSTGTPQANPASGIAAQHAKIITDICKQLGLSFTSRARADAPESAPKTNPFAV